MTLAALSRTAPLTDPYDPGANGETFDTDGYLADIPAGLLPGRNSALRREATRYDPFLFAVLYFPHHLKTHGRISFADPHFEWVRLARRWAVPNPGLRADRHVFIAPRDTGKSSWFFLLLPMWAAAHGHHRFVVAFAHSGTQAETHLHAFRSELADNQALRLDYPDLCTPARKPNGKTTADNVQTLRTKNGFTFAARGIDSANLGIKERDARPSLIVCDDIEPDEAVYSPYQMSKRLGTLLEAILPMNLRASVALVGTVTMPGSIIHQCVDVALGTDEPAEWIGQEHFRVHYADPLPISDDGAERSLWPGKWPTAFIQSIRHTRTALKNFWNSPLGNDGGYWTVDDFSYGQLDNVTLQVLSIDPTITTKTTSDPAGISVISYAPGYNDLSDPRRPVKVPSRCQVEYAREVRLVGEKLRTYVLRVLAAYPRVRLIVVEGNQAGENWHTILHHMPVRVTVVWSTEKKEVRAAKLLELYQHRPPRVIHADRLLALEQQMCSFPRGRDDMIDSVGAVALRLLARRVRGGTVFPR